MSFRKKIPKSFSRLKTFNFEKETNYIKIFFIKIWTGFEPRNR